MYIKIHLELQFKRIDQKRQFFGLQHVRIHKTLLPRALRTFDDVMSLDYSGFEIRIPEKDDKIIKHKSNVKHFFYF